MEIGPKPNREVVPVRHQGVSPSPSTPASKPSDEVSTAGSEQARTLLESPEEVRPEVVARGKELAASPDYPPTEVREQIAKHIIENNE